MILGQDDAQGLTDAFCASGLAAGVATRWRRHSPVDLRLMFVFGGLSLFFAFRGTAILLDNAALRTMAQLMVAPLMLAGLALAESVLRRHAPRWLKTAVAAGGLLVCAILLGLGRNAPISHPAWGVYVTLSLLAMTMLVFTRDRAALSHQENASIDALLWALGALTVLAVTDFLSASPVMMSGIGAALLALFARFNANSQRGVRQGVAEVAVILASAVVFTVLLARALQIVRTEDVIRLGVVTTALLIALTLILAALRGRAGQDDAHALRSALANADLSSLPAFLDSLAGHPLLRGLLMAEGALLAEYDHASLRETLLTRLVWRRPDTSGNPAGGRPRGRDELEDLLVRTDSSHAALVSADPIRIALLTLPDVGPSGEAETDLALFCKLAAVAARGCA